MNQNDQSFIQNQIGYTFKNPDLLQQAFVRRSYSKENGGENNEVLEFIGDKALDFIVVKLLTEEFGSFSREYDDYNPDEDFDEFVSEYQENDLTEMKKKLVEKTTLANCIDNLGLAEYLIMGKGDVKNNVQNSDSVKEDLFEAIIGAIALDSDWDIAALEDSTEVMLNPDEIIYDESMNYVAEIQEWSLNESGMIPLYCFFQTSMQGTWYSGRHPKCIYGQAKPDTQYGCELQFNGVDYHFVGYGSSKSIARMNACELAYHYLEDHDMLYSIRDEIENPSLDMAINQLETLARRGYFSIPTYHFAEEHDNNGNPIWECECHIEEIDAFFLAKSPSKKRAKKEAAYEMLKEVLDLEEND